MMGAPSAERRLSRRDLFLLPALSLLTVLVMLAGSELIARLEWPEQQFDACRIDDAVTGLPRFKANCTSRVKVPEGPWVNNAYNDCGYRTLESCLSKAAGSTRVAVLGTSFSYGYMTPYGDAYTTLAGKQLSRDCARPVEFQNLGFPNYTLVDVYQRVDEALALHPDLLMLAINPIDVRKDLSPDVINYRNDPASRPKRSEPQLQGGWLRTAIIGPLRESRAMYVVQHFLYQNPDTYLDLYLLYGDNAGYLRSAFSPAWQQRLGNLDIVLKDMAEKARAAAVPLVLFLGPQPSQVALLNSNPRNDVDAYAFSRAVAAVAAKYDVPVLDPLSILAHRENSMSLFYVVDGHFSKPGQQILADELVRGLLAHNYPGFAGCTR